MSSQAQEANNTTDKEERKRLRKKRIEKSSNHDNSHDDDLETKTQATNKTGYQQTVDSLFHMDRRYYFFIFF